MLAPYRCVHELRIEGPFFSVLEDTHSTQMAYASEDFSTRMHEKKKCDDYRALQETYADLDDFVESVSMDGPPLSEAY